MAQQQADALTLLAEAALRHGVDPGAPGDRYQVVVHVDAAVLTDPEAPGQSVLEGGCRTSRCSVGAITAPCTRRGIRWNDNPTESYCSGDRTDDLYPTFRLHRPSPTIIHTLRARNEAAGLHLHARTACPGWLGERLDVGWAIDVLHPRALQLVTAGE